MQPVSLYYQLYFYLSHVRETQRFGLTGRILGAEIFWITIDPRTKGFNWDSLLEKGNWNSSTVINNYIHGTKSLPEIFQPALAMYQVHSGSSDNGETTY